ncbi:UDP-glucuronate 4-epimerase 3-like [Rhododendron vialii]|uniref:UDP-glucuronate 4-epimerase 3-like n=1 Tax=Rhododendron vialii TaxID=182163 RepID=UPI00265FCDF5|nr:UDP-glucuronate 4-epimerase 3-like [Rhododendron vialii]
MVKFANLRIHSLPIFLRVHEGENNRSHMNAIAKALQHTNLIGNKKSYILSGTDLYGALFILEGKEISVSEGPNHGTVARDFTYIDDVVKGCLASLDTAKKRTGSGGKKKGAAQLRIFNLGNTKPVPVSKLLSILEKLLKLKAKRKVVSLPRNGDVQFTHANISLAYKELGYKPTTNLETGLKKFVKWYVGYYDPKKKSAW